MYLINPILQLCSATFTSVYHNYNNSNKFKNYHNFLLLWCANWLKTAASTLNKKSRVDIILPIIYLIHTIYQRQRVKLQDSVLEFVSSLSVLKQQFLASWFIYNFSIAWIHLMVYSDLTCISHKIVLQNVPNHLLCNLLTTKSS